MKDKFAKEFSDLMKKYGFTSFICIVNDQITHGSIVHGDECDLASVLNDVSEDDPDFKEVLQHAASHRVKDLLEDIKFKSDLKTGMAIES